MALLNAYAAMLPRLQAEEALLAVQVGAVAAGRLEEREARTLLHGWEQMAAGPTRPDQDTPAKRQRLTQAQGAAMLSSAGFGMRG